MIRRIALLACLLVIGCGSSSPGGGSGGSGGTGGGAGSGGSGGNGTGGNAGADMALGPDMTTSLQCGNLVCHGAEKCCGTASGAACMTACPDGGFQASCSSPSDCGGNPCCITIGNGFSVQSVACTNAPTACPPMVNVQTQSGMDRACKVDADCTSGVSGTPQLPDCCTNTQTMQHVCFNKSYVQFVQGWTCP
jgi:hypothetical protein